MFILSRRARWWQYLINSAFLSFFWVAKNRPKSIYLRLLLVASLLILGYDATASSNPIWIVTTLQIIGQYIIWTDCIHIQHCCTAVWRWYSVVCCTQHCHFTQAWLEHCNADLDAWFCFNSLCLNPSKHKAILLGTHQRLLSFPTVLLSSNSHWSITTLGVITDKHFTFDSHVSALCHSAFSSSRPEAHTFLSYRGHGCIYSKRNSSIRDRWIMRKNFANYAQRF